MSGWPGMAESSFLRLPVAVSPWMISARRGAQERPLAPSIGSSSSSGRITVLSLLESGAESRLGDCSRQRASGAWHSIIMPATCILPVWPSPTVRAEISAGRPDNRHQPLYRPAGLSPAVSGAQWLAAPVEGTDDRLFHRSGQPISDFAGQLAAIGSLSWAGNDWVLTGRVERYQTCSPRRR